MDDYIAIAALNQYSYCPHRCWRMFCAGGFVENRYTLEGTGLHERVHTVGEGHREETFQVRAIWLKSERVGEGHREETFQVRAIWLKSERYRLIGKSDLLEEIDGQWYPIEYKRGRKGEYDNDELQVCAQALCLEEMLGKSITQGYVYYAQSHQRQLVEITEALRQETISTIHAVTTLLETGRMPPAIFSPRCKGCSLYDQCLPKAAEAVNQYREA